MQRRFRFSLALTAILVSVGLILGYVEGIIFPQGISYGIKLGISNVVVIFAIVYAGYCQAILIAVVKSVLSGLLFSSVTSVVYSVCGAILSIVLMALLKKIYYPDKLSLIGISIAGSAAFNIGQVLIACLMMGTYGYFYLLVYMLSLSVVTGAVIGIVTYLLLNGLKRGI